MKNRKTKLKQSVIERINTPDVRIEISSQYGCIDATLYQHLKENKPGGWLTKLDFLTVVSKVLKEPIESLTETVSVPVAS